MRKIRVVVSDGDGEILETIERDLFGVNEIVIAVDHLIHFGTPNEKRIREYSITCACDEKDALR